MWRLAQAVQSMLTMMLTWRTGQTLAGAISNGLHDGVAKRRRLGHESAVTTYYVCTLLPTTQCICSQTRGQLCSAELAGWITSVVCKLSTDGA